MRPWITFVFKSTCFLFLWGFLLTLLQKNLLDSLQAFVLIIVQFSRSCCFQTAYLFYHKDFILSRTFFDLFFNLICLTLQSLLYLLSVSQDSVCIIHAFSLFVNYFFSFLLKNHGILLKMPWSLTLYFIKFNFFFFLKGF